MDKVLIIDFMNFLYRASISFKPGVKHSMVENGINCLCGSPWNQTTNSCYGQDYTIVYNYFRNLRPIIEQFSPNKCIIVMEGHPQFRYDLFPEYKANRIVKRSSVEGKSNFDKLISSSEIVVSLMKFLPLTLARAANYECDDVVSTLCDDLQEEHVTVVSNDSDFLQLLQRGYKNTFVYSANKKEYMQAPDYPYVAWKSLNGDKSDNIPGLVKPKKAMQLATTPSLFEDFMKIEENRANFSVNRQLIEFSKVPKEDISLIDCEANYPRLRAEFDSMKFESITNDNSWQKFCQTFEKIKF